MQHMITDLALSNHKLFLFFKFLSEYYEENHEKKRNKYFINPTESIYFN